MPTILSLKLTIKLLSNMKLIKMLLEEDCADL